MLRCKYIQRPEEVLSCFEGRPGVRGLDAFPGHSACWPLTAAWGSVQAPELGVQWKHCGGQLLLLPAALKAPVPSLPGAAAPSASGLWALSQGTAGQHSCQHSLDVFRGVAGYIPLKPAGRRKKRVSGGGQGLGVLSPGRPGDPHLPHRPHSPPVLHLPVTAESTRLLTPTTIPSAQRRPTALEPW